MTDSFDDITIDLERFTRGLSILESTIGYIENPQKLQKLHDNARQCYSIALTAYSMMPAGKQAQVIDRLEAIRLRLEKLAHQA